MSPQLTIYIRTGCHLCEDMLQELQQRQASMNFMLDVIDIDGQPDLEPQYGTKVPVLVSGNQEICHYFLDEVAFKQCFRDA